VLLYDFGTLTNGGTIAGGAGGGQVGRSFTSSSLDPDRK